jgi:hypothetical protein
VHQVALPQDRRNEFKISVCNPKGKCVLKNMTIDANIILGWILEK